jgi:phenolic acid decarboxylase
MIEKQGVEMSTPVFAGHSYPFQVDNGMELHDNYSKDGQSLRWEAVKGQTKGQSETVDLQVAEVADGIYFVSWLESSGMTVSRVMNFNTGGAPAFWTMPDDSGVGGRAAQMHMASMRELKKA